MLRRLRCSFSFACCVTTQTSSWFHACLLQGRVQDIELGLPSVNPMGMVTGAVSGVSGAVSGAVSGVSGAVGAVGTAVGSGGAASDKDGRQSGDSSKL